MNAKHEKIIYDHFGHKNNLKKAENVLDLMVKRKLVAPDDFFLFRIPYNWLETRLYWRLGRLKGKKNIWKCKKSRTLKNRCLCIQLYCSEKWRTCKKEAAVIYSEAIFSILWQMWILFDIWCGKHFAISIGQIQPKLIFGLVTYGPNGL